MAPCVRFLQCAGCRFDSPFWEGPKGWAAQRNKDLWQTFEAVISLCVLEKIDLLFLTGNLFEQEYAHKETVERVARLLAKLKDTKIFITPGERDPFVTTSAYRLAVWPNNVHIFSSGITSVKIPSKNVTVYGAGWTAYQQDGSFLDGFQSKRDGTIPIMLLHAEVKSVSNDNRLIPIHPEHIAASGLIYLALGHQGGWCGTQKTGETVWADSGFVEARSFIESGSHGVIIGEIEQDSVKLEFREMGQRHYIEKTLTVQSNLESLTTKLLSETSPEERQRDMFRVKLSGPFREVEAAVLPLQKLLADKYHFVEVIHAEEMDSEIETVVVIPLGKKAGNREDHPTLTDLFINKLQERQVAAMSTETHGHWELVMKIGLSALAQGRIDDEN